MQLTFMMCRPFLGTLGVSWRHNRHRKQKTELADYPAVFYHVDLPTNGPPTPQFGFFQRVSSPACRLWRTKSYDSGLFVAPFSYPVSHHELLVRWRIQSDKVTPASQSEKRYDFSALYISVRNPRGDEFWDEG